VPGEQEHDELLMSLVESVIELPPEERDAHLRALCSDPALIEEVRTRVVWEERMGSFLRDPLVHPPAVEDAFAPERYLGRRFRIIREIGRGGMGIVYEAIDMELDARVALKCAKLGHSSRLPPEARAAREVSHFNVCKVHDLHKVPTEFGEMDVLSMEFIEGETLCARLVHDRRLRELEAREIALQICAGLAQAHRQGVIHGDMKCSNIILARSPEGGMRAVITDFGLAKLKLADGSQLRGAQGGTFHYMAPELFRGEPASLASDLYALGVLFHTMLAGYAPERVHPSLPRGLVQTWKPGSNASTVVLDRKISNEDWERRIAELPSPWKKIVTRCLSPRPGKRFESAEDIIRALTRRPAWVTWAAAGAVGAAAVTGWYLWAANQGSRIDGLMQLTSATELAEGPSLSRDEKAIAWASDRAEAGNLDIWVQPLPAGQARRLTTNSSEDNSPSISPDGSIVAFRSERNGGGIYLVDAARGSERLLVPGGRNPQFSPDGQRLAYWSGDTDESAPSGRIYWIAVNGGPAHRLAADFEDARYPTWSSDGRLLLFSGCRGSGQLPGTCVDWWTTTADGASVIQTGAMPILRRQQIVPTDSLGSWLGERVIFSGMRERVGSLWELTISRRSRKAAGRPRQLTSGDARENGVTVAENGSMAFGRLAGALHIWRIAHASAPSAISQTKVTGGGTNDISPYVASHGRWLVFARRPDHYLDVWIKDLRSGKESPAVVSNFDKASPLIDDSGTAIVYEQREPGVSAILAATSGQSPKKLCDMCTYPMGWFEDGQSFFFSGNLPSKILLMEIKSGAPRVALDAGAQSVSNADWSPATEYLLFTAADGDRKQIFAVRFPRAGAQPAGNWIPLTREEEWSDRPRWSGDGKTAFYLSNRDGFSCVWGRRFDPIRGKPAGEPFAVAHYHDPRISPSTVNTATFRIAVSGDSVFVNLGEVTESLWTAKLKSANFFRIPSFFPYF
jgi:Tol biopolymer transport system component